MCLDRDPSLLQILLEHGAHVDRVDEDGKTALQNVVLDEKEESTALLLRYGADANIPVDKANGLTLLHICAAKGSDSNIKSIQLNDA